MAQTRLEKVGNIYTRIASLMKAGGMGEENKPLWFEIYKAYPPKYEPRYDRPGLTTPVRNIFYKEDKIRAKFHKEYKYYSMVNMLDNSHVSKTEQFLLIYKQFEREGVPEAELYDKAIQEFLSKVKSEKIEKEAQGEESSKSAQRRKNVKSVSEEKVINDEAKIASEESEQDSKQYKPIRLSLEKLFENPQDGTKKSE